MESKNLKKRGSFTSAGNIYLMKKNFKLFGRGYYTRAALIRVRKLLQRIRYLDIYISQFLTYKFSPTWRLHARSRQEKKKKEAIVSTCMPHVVLV